MNKLHTSVLLKEMLSLLSPQDNKVYVDATFGAGGYSKGILESADCKVYAIDRDETVTEFYDDLNVSYPNRANLLIDKFSNIKKLLNNEGIVGVDGVVLT